MDILSHVTESRYHTLEFASDDTATGVRACEMSLKVEEVNTQAE